VQPDQGKRDERWAQMLRAELQDAEIPISACLGRAQISLADLINLKPGDVVPCDFAGKATVSAEDIQQAVKKYLGPERRQLVEVLPAEAPAAATTAPAAPAPAAAAPKAAAPKSAAPQAVAPKGGKP